MRVLIFGDSITQGFWDAYGGWVQRLAHEYHPKTLASILENGNYKVQIFNMGISGDTVEDVASRIDAETKVRISSEQGTMIVIAIGLNDAKMRNNRALMDVYDFQTKYESIIDKALKLTPKVICVGLIGVNEMLTNPSPYSDNDSQWTNNRINAFEDTVKQSAGRKDVPFIPIHDQFLAALASGQELMADGLHPNEAGHQFIADLVKPPLDELISS